MRRKFRVLLPSQAVYGVLPLIGASMLGPGALAQADERPRQAKVVDNIVVTASRTEQNVADVPASIEVIGQDEILNTTGVDITDILKKNASVDVIQYPGSLAGVGLRGFRPEFSGTNKRVLVLIDGRPAGAESMGNIATAGLARIEVLKGSASSIYGASAMGGVVNYISRKSDGELGGSINVGYGSYGTVKLGARFGGAISDRVNFDMAFTHLAQHDGFKLGSGGETFGTFVQGNGAVRPNTEFVNNNIYARAAVKLGGDWGAESDGTGDQSDKEESNYGSDVSLTGSIGNHDLLALYYRPQDEQSFFNKPPGKLEFLSFTNDIDWMGVQLQDKLMTNLLGAAQRGHWNASPEDLAQIAKRLAESVADHGPACEANQCRNPAMTEFIGEALESLPDAAPLMASYNAGLSRAAFASSAPSAVPTVTGQVVEEVAPPPRPAESATRFMAAIIGGAGLVLIAIGWFLGGTQRAVRPKT